MDFDPGVPVRKVWKNLSRGNRRLIIKQLRQETMKMRENTQPLIGRVGVDGNIAQNEPYDDPYHPGTSSYKIKFFVNESDFDAHKIEQVRRTRGELTAKRVEALIKPLQKQSTEKYVLTHRDLHDQNIHVRCIRDSKGKRTWELSGILDWGDSGFYPEYMEYAMAMRDEAGGLFQPY